VICFGTRAGKQHTFALLDEWVPEAKRMERDAALAELTFRYFASHERRSCGRQAAAVRV
jgi:hypothetical protein